MKCRQLMPLLGPKLCLDKSFPSETQHYHIFPLMKLLRKSCLAAFVLGAIAVLFGVATDNIALWRPAVVLAAIGLSIGLGALQRVAGYQFTSWIFTCVVVGMCYPSAVLHWGDFDLRHPWLILIAVQMVMFGMGTQMGLRDFAGVLKMPWGVVVAVLGQFTIMPLVGFGLTRVFDMPNEVAAGVILIGSCSSGLASNVMCYIARANLALSITATSITTLIAPIVTPMWMMVLAGTLLDISFVNMMVEISKIVVVPIGAALLHDYLKFAGPRGRRLGYGLAIAGAAWLLFLFAFGGRDWQKTVFSGTTLLLLELGAFLLGACTAGVLYHRLTRLVPAVERILPRFSMLGIMYFTIVTTAAGRDNLLKIGGVLFVVSVLHNGLGYLLGYWAGKAGGLDKASCRTIAIEVGLQNGGMAAGLAGAMGKLATVGLASTVFGAWMNISGSALATYWSGRPAVPPRIDASRETGRAP